MNGNLAIKQTNNNVVGFPVNSVEDKINTFLNNYDSINTRSTYRNHYMSMFMYICGKDINRVTLDDVMNIDIASVKKYRDYLRTKYKSNTVNQNIFACKSLWDSFKEDELVVGNCFDIKKIKIKQETHYGSLTSVEMENLYDYCLTLNKGMTKKLYFEFLATVTCRKAIAQELKLSDIKKKHNKKTNEYFWVIDSYDKTEEVDRAITDEFYNRLKSNFDNYNSYEQGRGYLFNVENQTLEKTLREYCTAYNIDRVGRNIVQHSIKSSGLDIIQDVFNDINMTAKAGGHKNIQTAYNNYIGKNVDYSQQPSILLGKGYNVNMLEDMSKEELLEAIKMCGQNTVTKVCMSGQKLGNN